MIPPEAQRHMATRAGATMIEEKGSHAIYVSQPRAVAALIARAAVGVDAPAWSEEAEQAGKPDSGREREGDVDRHVGA
jgi:hypothetical protein